LIAGTTENTGKYHPARTFRERDVASRKPDARHSVAVRRPMLCQIKTISMTAH
jgi:hypothetical protein